MDRNRGLDIGALRQQIEDLLDDFTGGSRRQQGGRPAGADQPQHLSLNIIDSEDRIIVTAPLPGLAPDEIDITVRGQSLALRAHQKTPPTDRPQFVRREWGLGPYHRTIELPSPVEADKAEASFRNGVVTITLPKADPSRPRVINLQDEGQPAPPEPPTPTEADSHESEPQSVSVAETNQIAVQDAEAPPETPLAAEAAPPAEGASEETSASFYMRPPRRRGGESRSAREAARRAAAKEKAAAEKAASDEGSVAPAVSIEPAIEPVPDPTPVTTERDSSE